MLLNTKHSSGDLLSRLKTRKILGVGETDNGDVHRSKISQVLGHNEHLYVKFPKGYTVWYFSMAIFFTVSGVINYLPSSNFCQGSPKSSMDQDLTGLSNRFYGASQLAFATLFWCFWDTTDKTVVRRLIAAVQLAHVLQLIAVILYSWNEDWRGSRRLGNLVVRFLAACLNGYFYRAVGSSNAGIRKSFSLKDLSDSEIKRQPCETEEEGSSVDGSEIPTNIDDTTDELSPAEKKTK
ncbi:tumor protein p53-inducible protein 11-like isoform X2 [Limulus polyphemus]|uniref:Tumor protein p53-inducible protein 11 n=1 Tax=Limulus polyphemus TaxID=6850 RepID=A0ABM1B347_LIMPO|nr:tumor protein p53-inducible protein 11-like isoform X2 [Limulus polyphemus]